jgi:hypothetical protein
MSNVLAAAHNRALQSTVTHVRPGPSRRAGSRQRIKAGVRLNQKEA